MSKSTRDFPNKTEYRQALPIEFKVLIPSTRQQNIKIASSAFNKRVNEAVRFLTKRFGGSTIDIETGTYMMKNKTIKEKVASITVSASVADYNRYDEEIEKYLKEKKKAWGQDSMGFVYQGRMMFV